MLELLSTYQSEARHVPLEAFVARFPEPILIIDAFAPVSDDDGGFQTVAASAKSGALNTPTVARIKKRAGANSFGSMITVGRAPNNDIAISAVVISKFHAYFVLLADKSYAITDAGSTNGTFVQGKRLDPKTERAPVAPGDEVRFGELRARFFTPETAWPYLRAVTAQPRPDGSAPEGNSRGG